VFLFAQTNHIVVSEFATRGPASALDEFVELHNPTDNPISIAGWRIQYKSATGTTWTDNVTIPAGAIISGRGFFLMANSAYAGTVTPDVAYSASGFADNGHLRLVDGATTQIDKVGWGTANDPEGTAAPNHGTTANGNSVERKARVSSTADSLASGGLHAQLGNGQDTDNNGADFVAQIRGRNPQNTASAPEPVFAQGGSGTGRVTASPPFVYTSRSVASLAFSFRQDSGYTLTRVSIVVPSSWAWSRTTADVQRSGSAFASASVAISGDTVLISAASLTATDSGTISILNLTSPSTKGATLFSIRTSTATGSLAPIAVQPRVRTLELVPVVVVHVNDAQGVPAAPYQLGAEATVTGVVTANLNPTRTDLYVQDVTGGINIFSFDPPPTPINVGDSVTVTGTILQFRGLTEISPEFALLQRHAMGRPVPPPMLLTCADVNATFRPDFTEPNESRLVRVNGVTYNQTASTITDATGTTGVFIPNTFPPVPGVFDIIGVLKQFKPGTNPPPPYTADYEIVPRDSADIIAHPGPIITSTPFEDQLQPTSVRVNWRTNVNSNSIVRYGLTPALGESTIVNNSVTDHSVTVSGLLSARAYYYSVGSGNASGTNFSPVYLLSTASPSQSTGAMNVYFNKSVNTNLAWFQPANANQSLVQRIVTRINNARRSIDVALYSLSGAPGTSIANALVAARTRGVRIRVICEDDNRNSAAFNFIFGNGILLITDRYDPLNNGLGLHHNKFFVMDGRGGAPESTWVWTGSWNPTDPGTNDDYQNAIEIQDAALANAFTMEFNEMWGSDGDVPVAANSRFGARKLDNTPHRFMIGAKPVELYFSPSDGTNGRIVAEINRAEQSVGFQLLTLTRNDIANALIARRNAGKRVRGDLDNGIDAGSQYSYLVSNGIDVRLKTGSGLLHHKYGIIDAEYPYWNSVTITGSHNWSSAAETANNENTLVIRDGNITNQYLQEFAARYYQFGGNDSIRVSVEEVSGEVPEQFALRQNYPNPFNPITNWQFTIGNSQLAILKVYDMLGSEVRTLVNETLRAGTYRVQFDATNLASGVYYYRLTAGLFSDVKKMIVMK
jgi:phosphatidylserine/phosphatidylglycerophosphate/cardiolipin synthase-like enzyme